MIPLAQKRRLARGFTLVELLAVIAIIALLSAILFPVMATVRKNAREGSCMSNMHTLIQGMKMYKDDWRVYPDALYAISYGGGPAGARLYPDYVKDEKTFNCPESPKRLNDRGAVSPLNPMTGAAAMGLDPASGAPVAYQMVEFSSYDFQYRPNNRNAVNPAVELHYRRHWNPQGASVFDDPRQLVYKEPPDSTVATWCLYHSNMDQAGMPAKDSMALVAFLSGRVQKIPAEKVAAWPASCTSPAAGQPPQGCPWQVSPKP